MPGNAAYSTEPSRGEFPQPGSKWFNGTIVGGSNALPCPLTLTIGYEISDSHQNYDQANLYPVAYVDNYYLVANLKNPINQVRNEVYYVNNNGVATQVDASEPYNNPRTQYMRQLYDYDTATYCGERVPHNPHDSDPCAVQRTLNMFKP